MRKARTANPVRRASLTLLRLRLALSNLTAHLFAEQVRWHRSLEEVPVDAPAIVLAHEFFDALPVHQFQVLTGSFAHLNLSCSALDRDESASAVRGHVCCTWC